MNTIAMPGKVLALLAILASLALTSCNQQGESTNQWPCPEADS